MTSINKFVKRPAGSKSDRLSIVQYGNETKTTAQQMLGLPTVAG